MQHLNEAANKLFCCGPERSFVVGKFKTMSVEQASARTKSDGLLVQWAPFIIMETELHEHSQTEMTCLLLRKSAFISTKHHLVFSSKERSALSSDLAWSSPSLGEGRIFTSHLAPRST